LEGWADGEVPQVLLISILTGFAIANLGEAGKRALSAIEVANKVVFGIVRIVVRAAPLGALGGMAFTVGSYGVASLTNLLKLMGDVLSVEFFCSWWWCSESLRGWRDFRFSGFLAYIKDELLIVLGTSSSETVLPDMMRKLEGLGGFAFSGGAGFFRRGMFSIRTARNIYLTLAALFSGAGYQYASFAGAGEWNIVVSRWWHRRADRA